MNNLLNLYVDALLLGGNERGNRRLKMIRAYCVKIETAIGEMLQCHGVLRGEPALLIGRAAGFDRL